ncbi:hypothetical protein NC651_006873 [Populus alba x Populus x berolinensis]|nr:hypothetical protein NC651_006873 [Populus alba x Populus x berolinensis]
MLRFLTPTTTTSRIPQRKPQLTARHRHQLSRALEKRLHTEPSMVQAAAMVEVERPDPVM